MLKTLVKMKFGSQLYGTNTPQSDTDIKAVHIADVNDILLNRVTPVINYSETTKKEGEKNSSEDVDFESYELNKYVALLCQGQTVAIDMLFAPREYWLEYTPEWELLVHNRELFLTKKAQSFIGYCRTQANKYGIKGSRVAAARKAVSFFHLLEESFLGQTKMKDVWQNVETFVKLGDSEFIQIIEDNENNEFLLSVCNRKIQSGIRLKDAAKVYYRLFDEYGERSLQAENNEGIDWKALSHAVRIGQQAVELFTTGKVLFPRPNATELLEIKQGKWEYNVVATMIENLLEDVEKEAENSSFPSDVDQVTIEVLILSIIKSYVLEEIKI
jgi:predicted nucleotidyltransferase